MAMQHRSKSLHNFSLPCFKWGNQRVLRCVKLTSDHRNRSSPPSSSIPNGFLNNHKSIATQPNPVSPDVKCNGGVKRFKASPPLDQGKAGEIDDPARPWNLRTRRAACKAPLRIDQKTNDNSPEIDSPSSVKKQSVEAVKDRIKFSVPLSKREIEQDFMEMAKIRPPRRPKKRPRIVQKYLDVRILPFFLFFWRYI